MTWHAKFYLQRPWPHVWSCRFTRIRNGFDGPAAPTRTFDSILNISWLHWRIWKGEPSGPTYDRLRER